MSDIYEIVFQLNPNEFADSVWDGDGDGLLNFEEALQQTSPGNPDTFDRSTEVSLSNGTTRNGTDFEHRFGPTGATPPPFDVVTPLSSDDWDGDTMPNEWEHRYGFDSFKIRSAANTAEDVDLDGLNNLQEWLLDSNPTIPDQDGNGVLDSEDDWDQDGVRNRLEQLQLSGEIWGIGRSHSEPQIVPLSTTQSTTALPGNAGGSHRDRHPAHLADPDQQSGTLRDRTPFRSGPSGCVRDVQSRAGGRHAAPNDRDHGCGRCRQGRLRHRPLGNTDHR